MNQIVTKPAVLMPAISHAIHVGKKPSPFRISLIACCQTSYQVFAVITVFGVNGIKFWCKRRLEEWKMFPDYGKITLIFG